jgi:hypothetical protein
MYRTVLNRQTEVGVVEQTSTAVKDLPAYIINEFPLLSQGTLADKSYI